MKLKTIRVAKNAWGNFNGFIGADKVFCSGGEWEAKEWLVSTLESGECKMSEKSYFSAEEVEKHRKATR